MASSDQEYRVVVVCWGNICRSPMGEFILRQAFEEAGLGDRVSVSSAGTSTDELGRPMDRRTVAALHRHLVADTGFRAKRATQFRDGDFDGVDLVLATDLVHERILGEQARTESDRAKIRLLRSFDPDAVADGTLGMDDPWYGDDTDFDVTYAEISAATPGIVDHVRRHLSRDAAQT